MKNVSHNFLVFFEENHSLFLNWSMIGICILDSGIAEDKLYVLNNAVALRLLYTAKRKRKLDVTTTVAVT